MRTEFLDFFDSEYVLIVRFLIWCGASVDEAEDAIQDAFTETWAQKA